ncbi:MAG: hypothetical protein Kow0074_20260 [Candidatus Zixiibacteriota bacterium]
MMRIAQTVEVAPGLDGIEVNWTFWPRNNGRKSKDDPSDETRDIEPGNIPRVSRLMALTIKFDSLGHPFVLAILCSFDLLCGVPFLPRRIDLQYSIFKPECAKLYPRTAIERLRPRFQRS